MRIQHNIPALSAYRNYSHNVSAVNKNLEKLSSGYKINRAGDDAAGLAISEKMRIQISGLEQAQNNAKSGINLVQTAEGALTEVHDMLNRMYTLAEQSANGTYADEVDREQLQKEVNSLRTEINRIADATNYNGIKLLDGSLDAGGKTTYTEGEFKAVAAGETATAAGQLPEVGKDLGTNTVVHKDAAEGSKTCAFSIDLHNVALKKGGKMDIEIGVAKISIDNSTGASDLDAKAIVAKIAAATGTTSGVQIDGADFEKDGVTINGTQYKVTTSGDTRLTFTQLDADTTTPDIPAEIKISDPDATLVAATKDKYVTGAITFTQAPGGASDPDTAAKVTVAYTDATGASKTKEISFTAGTNVGTATGALVTALSNDTDLKALFDITGDATNGISFEAKTAGAGKGAVTSITYAGTANKDSITIGAKNTTDSVTGADAYTPDSNVSGDYNKSTTVIQTKSDGADARLASTKFSLTADMVKDGSTITIGKDTYTFTTDASKAKEEGFVVYNEGDDVSSIAEKLTKAAEKNTTYTVGHDGTSITVTENEGQQDFDLTTVAGIEKSLGFKTAATSAKDDSKALTLQIGDTADDYNKLAVSVSDMHADAMGIGSIDISTQAGASAAMKAIKAATNYVSDVRGDLGALQNRLDHTINNLSVTQENITDAESTIRDVDIAKEMMAYTKNNILVQSAQAMLAQANQLPQGVLQLLG